MEAENKKIVGPCAIVWKQGWSTVYFPMASEGISISEIMVATKMMSAAELRGMHAREIKTVFLSLQIAQTKQ